MWQTYKKVVITLLLFLITLLMISTKEPLNDVHWDAPIYMFAASRLNNEAALQHFAANAAEIAHEIPNTKPFSGEYWTFSRAGHIALLGSVVTVFGATSKSIQISTGLYIALLILAVVMSAFVATTTIELLGLNLRKSTVANAAAFSSFLYMASDIFGYLAGNLVTEVPALLLLSTSAWLMLKALQKHSLLLAIASGICAFLLYVVRMESIWNYIAFVVCLAMTLFWRARTLLWLPGIAGAALFALFLYALYAWAFYPLANPGAFLDFAMSQKGFNVGRTNAVALLVVAGGGLWIGFLLSFRAVRSSPAAQFSLSWLFLTFLPWLPSMVLNLPVQTRMLSFVMPPLLLASTLGWAALFETWKKHLPVTAAFALVTILMTLISNPFTYSLSQSLPVVWRFQYVRTFLAAPEKSTYPINLLRELSHTIYATTVPTIVLWDPKQIREEDLWVVQYFAPHDLRLGDAKKQQNLRAKNVCDDKMPLPVIKQVVFCTKHDTDTIRRAGTGGMRIILLRATLSKYGPTNLHLEEIPFNQLGNAKES